MAGVKTLEKTVEVLPEEAPANGVDSGKPHALSLDDIIAAPDIRYEWVSVPEWSGSVRVVSLTGVERNKVTRYLRDDVNTLGPAEGNALYQIRIVAASLVDDEGRHIASQTDAPKLAKKSLKGLMRVFRVCAELSGLGDEEVDKVIEALKATPSGGSSTD